MPENESIAVRLFDKSKIALDKEIGSGSFGTVYKATIREGELNTVAVKVFKKELQKGETSQGEKEKAYDELLKVAVLDHENVVKLHGMVHDPASELPWLVFEFMKDGNLLEYVIKNDNIKEKTLIRFCRDICSGMAFLHSNKVLHKDLAARNILLNDRTAKIADLGLSSFLSNDEGDVYALNGKLFPYRHAAIECIVEQIYSFESDVWSFGVLMHEIFNGGLAPYGKDNKQPEVRRFIVEGITPLHLLEPHCSVRILLIMKSIFNPNMAERPTFQKLLKKFHKCLNGTFGGLELKSKENVPSHKDTTAAFSTFHKIKASGLSASINNLQFSDSSSSSGPNSHVLLSSKQEMQLPIRVSQLSKNDGFLTVSAIGASRSSSTPDIVTAFERSANTMQILANNFLTVKSPGRTRRHSLTKFGDEIPSLQQRRNSDKQKLEASQNQRGSFVHADEFVDEQRGRTNSSSRVMNNHLLDGFVPNRFPRKS